MSMHGHGAGWSRLTPSQLLMLVEIQRTGSLSRAALNLDVSPPAVSQQLARVEKVVGASLVERGPRGAVLTPLGRRLAEHGARVFEELQRAEDAASSFLAAHATRLRVGSLASISMSLLPPVLASLRYRYPDIELTVIDVLSDTGVQMVADNQLDISFAASYTGSFPETVLSDVLTAEVIVRDPMVVVLPDDHRLAGAPPGSPIDIADLAEDSWVSGPVGRPSRMQLEDVAAAAGFVPRVPFQTESHDVAQALAEAGVAIAFVPRLALSERAAARAHPLARGVYRDIIAVMPRTIDHVPLVERLLTGIRQTLADLDPAGLAT